MKCVQCRHSLALHSTTGGPCNAQRCNCRAKGITPEQAKVLKQK